MERAGRAVAWAVRHALPRHLRAPRSSRCAARATTAATGWSRRGCSRAGVCARPCSSSPTASTAPRSRARWRRPTSWSTRCTAPASAVRCDGDAAWVAEQLTDWAGEVVAVDIPSGVDGLTGAVAGSGGAGDPHGDVRGAQARARVRARPFVRRRGRGGRHRHRRSTNVADAPAGMVTAADVASWLPAARARRAQVAVGRADRRRLRRHDRCAHAREPRRDARRVRASCGARCRVHDAAATGLGHRGDHAPRLPADDDGALARAAAEALLAHVGRFAALAVGPGLGGVGEPNVEFVVRTLVAEARKPLVLDADGLNALNGDLAALRARQTLGGPVVLTPHAGEYQRLMGAPVGPNRLVAAARARRARRRGGAAEGSGHRRRQPRAARSR